jgi:hypothetical protein
VESPEPLPYSLGGIFLILKTDAIVFSNRSSRQCEKQFIPIAPLQLRHTEAAQPKRRRTRRCAFDQPDRRSVARPAIAYQRLPVTNAQCRIPEFSRKLRKNRFNAAFLVDRMSLPYKMQVDFAELRQGSFTPPSRKRPSPNPVISAG